MILEINEAKQVQLQKDEKVEEEEKIVEVVNSQKEEK